MHPLTPCRCHLPSTFMDIGIGSSAGLTEYLSGDDFPLSISRPLSDSLQLRETDEYTHDDFYNASLRSPPLFDGEWCHQYLIARRGTHSLTDCITYFRRVLMLPQYCPSVVQFFPGLVPVLDMEGDSKAIERPRQSRTWPVDVDRETSVWQTSDHCRHPISPE